jgi:hypothetical protein
MEHIQLNMLGGADTITVEDLSGTDTNQVAIDLSSPAGSGTGDGAADRDYQRTANNDHISVVTSGNAIVVKGLAAQVTVSGAGVAQRLARRQRRCQQRHHRRVRSCRSG